MSNNYSFTHGIFIKCACHFTQIHRLKDEVKTLSIVQLLPFSVYSSAAIYLDSVLWVRGDAPVSGLGSWVDSTIHSYRERKRKAGVKKTWAHPRQWWSISTSALKWWKEESIRYSVIKEKRCLIESSRVGIEKEWGKWHWSYA